MLAADANQGRSIIVYKSDYDKIMPLDSNKLLAQAGPNADTVNFGEYIQKNLALYELTNDLKLNTSATAHFIRRTLADALRKGPYQTNLLLGGKDEGKDPELYWMDYLGAMHKLNFGAHGYGSSFTLSIFDSEWREGLSEAEGLEIIRHCIAELRTRFLISMPKFVCKIVDANGMREIEL
ncbi:unnamed protein product [Heterosigma akashiwo]